MGNIYYLTIPMVFIIIYNQYNIVIQMIHQFAKINLDKYINIKFLTLFHSRYGYCPLSAFQQIKSTKKTKKNNTYHQYILNFEGHLNQVSIEFKIPQVSLGHLIGESTATEVNKIITALLLPNSVARKQIEEIRSRILINLKQNEIINIDDFNLVYGIYKFIFRGKENIELIDLIKQQNKKLLKTILISLKKMIVLTQEKTNKKKSKKIDPYYINVDVKNILIISQKKLNQNGYVHLAQKLKDIRHSQKKNKWIGPRLWQILQKNEWNTDQISIFMRFFRLSAKYFDDMKSNPQWLERMIQKIVSNLQSLIRMLNKLKTVYQEKLITIQSSINDQNFDKNNGQELSSTQNSNHMIQQFTQQLPQKSYINFQDIEKYELNLINQKQKNIFDFNQIWI